jgi:hypothetical protein
MWLNAKMQRSCIMQDGCFSVSALARRAYLLVPSLSLYLMSLPALSADDYLSELDAEVKKVEARKIDGEAGEVSVQTPAEVSTAASQKRADGSATASRESFESLLKKNYLGTFGFYKKLPERSRQEIYAEYRDGAPISEVRKKIIDRLLQR